MGKRGRRRQAGQPGEDLRLAPELRLCAKFDSASIATFPVAGREEMGVPVVDNCAEEHIM